MNTTINCHLYYVCYLAFVSFIFFGCHYSHGLNLNHLRGRRAYRLRNNTQTLIGQNILTHNTLGSDVIDSQNATVEFRRILTSSYTVHTVPIILVSTSPHDPAYGALTIHNNNQPIIGLQPNIQTLDQILNWLKRSLGLSLPNHQTVMNWKPQKTYSLVMPILSVLKTASNVHSSELSVYRLTANLAPPKKTPGCPGLGSRHRC